MLFFDKIDKCCQDTSMIDIFIIWLIVMKAETKHSDVATHAYVLQTGCLALNGIYLTAIWPQGNES